MNSLRQKGVDLIRQSINQPAMTASRCVLLRMRTLCGEPRWESRTLINDCQSQNHSWAESAARFRCFGNMSRKFERLFVVVTAGLVLATTLAPEVLVSQEGPILANAPITFRYLKPGERGYAGGRSIRTPSGAAKAPAVPFTTFLITNHTAGTVVANLSAIEVKAGSTWITQMRPHGPLQFSTPTTNPRPDLNLTNVIIPGLTTSELKPNQTAYVTIQFSGGPSPSGPAQRLWVPMGMNHLAGAPTGAVWRLVVSVQEELTGLPDGVARIRGYPDMQARRAANGVTNASLNPFSGEYKFFGKPTRVVSQEVSTE
jgi:hypothetical protein